MPRKRPRWGGRRSARGRDRRRRAGTPRRMHRRHAHRLGRRPGQPRRRRGGHLVDGRGRGLGAVLGSDLTGLHLGGHPGLGERRRRAQRQRRLRCRGGRAGGRAELRIQGGHRTDRGRGRGGTVCLGSIAAHGSRFGMVLCYDCFYGRASSAFTLCFVLRVQAVHFSACPGRACLFVCILPMEPSRNPNLRKIPSQKIEERIWVGGRAIFFGFLGEGVEGVTQIPKKLLYFLYGHENVYKNPNVRGFPRNPKIVFTGFPQTLYFDLEPTQKTQVWVSGRLQ